MSVPCYQIFCETFVQICKYRQDGHNFIYFPKSRTFSNNKLAASVYFWINVLKNTQTNTPQNQKIETKMTPKKPH